MNSEICEHRSLLQPVLLLHNSLPDTRAARERNTDSSKDEAFSETIIYSLLSIIHYLKEAVAEPSPEYLCETSSGPRGARISERSFYIGKVSITEIG